MNQPPPLFDTNAAATLDRVKSIFTQRGAEYSDTWRTCQFLAMKAVAQELGAVIPEDAFRAIACAAFCDMKYQRLSGGYKEDSIDDGIAYNACLAEEVRNTKENRLPTLEQVQAIYAGKPKATGDIPCPHCRSRETFAIRDNSGNWTCLDCHAQWLPTRDPLYIQADSAAQKVNGHRNGNGCGGIHRTLAYSEGAGGSVCVHCGELVSPSTH